MIRRFLYHILFAVILFLLKTGKCLAQSQLTSGSSVQSLAKAAKKFEIAPMSQPSWAKKAGKPLFKVAWISDMHLRDEESVKASKTAFNMIRDELKANLTLITGDNCDYYKDLSEEENKMSVGVKRHLWLKRFIEKELARPYTIIPGDNWPWDFEKVFGPQKYSFDFGGFHFLMTATDAVALKVADAARLAGLDVPDDLRIVGINNDVFICEHSNPTLTSVQPDFEGCGYIAMATLHRIVQGSKARPQTILFGPKELVRRASTRILRCRDNRVVRALGYIEQHYAEPEINSERVSAVMGCSRSLADKYFRKSTGRTIREEIQERRLECAKRLLSDPNRLLSAVPSLCGCLSQTTFMRFFKSRTGMTMSEFRRKSCLF